MGIDVLIEIAAPCIPRNMWRMTEKRVITVSNVR